MRCKFQRKTTYWRSKAGTTAPKTAMMEPEFASAFRLAELIDAARNPMMSIGGAMPDEAIIVVLEDAIQALRDELS